ncbi:MAG TPA: sigma-70 family RNA polymerase sigma factor [Baekduia sp.]|uniref:RNA polymerase sigma factor n=1 Tax=Baekduia sp. TaxID=2600305 RepID=UPI002D79EAF1|nr:sigma-70 family RNA polymerase sigma factor [Baekduia sp.]HET6509355.1 sigma-70 family RNA polymerase sigma factor [Baekduia sp.]
MSTIDDEQDRHLARRARLGDEQAFAELVDRHRAPLVRWVARRSGRPELAEDAVQEGLMAAHRALRAADRSPNDVRAWLHTIAWRRAVDLVRRERPATELNEGSAVVPGPEGAVLRALELDRVVTVWSGLPERQREALRMSALEGRTLEEIGDALGVNAAAAKSLVARGRRALTERLTADELRCEDIRAEMLDATERGVRLGADAGRHVKACRDCSRLHRRARRRRRLHAAILSPPALVLSRLREYVFAIAGHEPQVTLATKVCAGACATALAGGIAAAPVATSTFVGVGGGAAVAGAVLRAERPAASPVPRRTHHRGRPVSTGATAGGEGTVASAATTTATASTATTGAATGTGTALTDGSARRGVSIATGTTVTVARPTTSTSNVPAKRVPPAVVIRAESANAPSARVVRGPEGQGADATETATAPTGAAGAGAASGADAAAG